METNVIYYGDNLEILRRSQDLKGSKYAICNRGIGD